MKVQYECLFLQSVDNMEFKHDHLEVLEEFS